IDGSPAQEIFIGKKYKIKADISNFFPSIYTHAICWALVGKEQAKIDRNNKKQLYYNKIDSSLQWLNYNETHGILIGPHTSNLISEIILVTIDDELKKKYEFIRNIDDYTCYTETKEKAEQFLIDLSKNLKDFGLSLNHKKTEIIELPISYDEEWKRKLNIFNFETHKNEIKFNSLVSFMDTALDLMKSNQNNAAILNYAIKTINNRKLTNNAKKYLIDTVHHLALLFPYLVQILESIFEKFEITKDKIKSILDDLFNLGKKSRNFEALAYAIYFSLLYDLRLDKEENIITLVEQKEDCVFMLLSYIYSKKNKLDTKKYVKIATGYKINEINNAKFRILDDEFWLFAYEILKNEKPVELNEVPDWKKIKDKNISFISEKFKQYILDK
ncbi:MAG: RNA-directed DNA polymerase, partial [Campylobacter sp.]|nr:RNA-directed DNA polymerase [Campylobacter sp.]